MTIISDNDPVVYISNVYASDAWIRRVMPNFVRDPRVSIKYLPAYLIPFQDRDGFIQLYGTFEYLRETHEFRHVSQGEIFDIRDRLLAEVFPYPVDEKVSVKWAKEGF